MNFSYQKTLKGKLKKLFALPMKNIEFSHSYDCWKDALMHSSSYEAEEIFNKTLESTLKVKLGKAAYERDSVIFNEIHYSWPTLAGIMWVAAKNNGKLNVLDFGGSLGSTYFQNKFFLESLKEIKWNIIEQKHYTSAGKKYIQDERIKFYLDIKTCLSENKPNVILLSSVLQYIEHPEKIIAELNDVGAEVFILDRTPISQSENNQIVVQHVPPSIYRASYPMWIFSQKNLDKVLSKNWNIIARNEGLNEQYTTSQGIDFAFVGMLLEAHK